MKKVLALIVIAMFTVLTLQPAGGEVEAASSLKQIQADIKAAKEQQRAAERRQAETAREAANAENQKRTISTKKSDLQKEINTLLIELDKVAVDKSKKQEEVDAKAEELLQTGVELDKAEERVIKRDELLQNRMRLMYTNGFVSYLDVLLSATSFSDFLDRFDALQSILNQDRNILEQHKKDKEMIIQKKADVELQHAELQNLYYELELKQADLIKKETEKELLVASYNQNLEQLDEQLDEFEHISEETEKEFMALASKVSKLEAEAKRIKNPYTGGKLAMPIKNDYRVSSNFGTRVHPISGKKHTHSGIDFAAPSGTPIYAAASGVVLVSQSKSSYGNAIIIDHGNGLWTLYAHIKNGGLLVDQGDEVKVGDKIALVGSTGNSTGPHLHFEVRKNEVAVNPGGYLK